MNVCTSSLLNGWRDLVWVEKSLCLCGEDEEMEVRAQREKAQIFFRHHCHPDSSTTNRIGTDCSTFDSPGYGDELG